MHNYSYIQSLEDLIDHLWHIIKMQEEEIALLQAAEDGEKECRQS